MGFVKKFRYLWHRDITGLIHDKLVKDIFLSCQNDALLRMGTDFSDCPRYKKYKMVKEHLFVKDIKGANYVRVGGEDDGAYVMIDDLNGKIAYSFGIGDNVKWDEQMAQKGYEIYQYDHTIDKLPVKNEKFHWEKIGVSGGGTKQDKLKTLEYILKKNGHYGQRNMILKMDIEGAEWEILKTVDLDILKGFDQIVLELHRLVDTESELIDDALSNISQTHQLVHIHANNAGIIDFCGDIFMPDLLEVTFASREKYVFENCTRWFPTKIDMPNYRFIPDIQLGQWN